MTTTRAAADARTSCASCSSSSTSTPSSWTGCRPTATSSSCPAGADVSVEGEPAECFYVLLEGTLTHVRLVGGSEVETVRTSYRGVYSGAVQFYFGDRLEQRYPATVRAVTDCRFLALPARAVRRGVPAVVPDGGPPAGGPVRRPAQPRRAGRAARAAARAGQADRRAHPRAEQPGGGGGPGRPRRCATGSPACGTSWRCCPRASSTARCCGRSTGLQEEFVAARRRRRRDLSALERSDREDALGEWLEDHEVPQPWELAGVFVAAGLGDGRPRPGGRRRRAVAPRARRCAGWPTPSRPRPCWPRSPTAPAGSPTSWTPPSSTRRWTGRRTSRPICTPGSTPRWSCSARRSRPASTVVKEYDRGLPPVPAYAGELNQVWTNLIVNALDAMAGEGTLTLRTRAGRRLRAGRDRRHRPGHPRGAAGPRVRAVLHDQAGRAGDRPRAGRLVADRGQAARR